MADPVSIAITRNDSPLVLLSIDTEGLLSQVRERLCEQGVIVDSDQFVDKKGFPVPRDKEGQWHVSALLERSEEKTLALKATEREAKKSVLSRLWEAANKGETMEAPKLPDLAGPGKLKREEASAEAHKYDLPIGAVTVAADTLGDVVRLDVAAWREIVERNNLLRGIRLDDGSPAIAFRSAFTIVGDIPRFVVHDAASVTATVTHSEHSYAMVENKISKVEASASYTFASASFERSRRDSVATANSGARTYVTGQWNLPRVILQLRPEDLHPAPDLVQQVRDIVDGKAGPEAQYFALRRLFRTYGQVWASEVVLGGQLSMTDELTTSASQRETDTEEAMRAAVGVKVGAFKAGAGVGIAKDGSEKSKQFEQFQNKSFQATGGDTRLAQDPNAWVATIGPAVNWRVIGRRGLLPLYLVLPADLREKVRDLLDRIDARFVPEVLEPGEPGTYPWGQAVRAEKDGFLVAQISGAGAKPEVWSAAAGAAGVPGRPAAALCATPLMAGNAALDRWTMVLPVRRRDTFVVEPLGLGAAVAKSTVHTRWYGMSYLEDAYFEPSEVVQPLMETRGFELGAPAADDGWAPRCDGFLVLMAETQPGVAGDVQLLDGAVPLAVLSLDALRCGVTHQSTCVPVLEGHRYRLTAGGGIGVNARFVPINRRLGGLARPIELKPSVCYAAESDGFVFGLVTAGANAVARVTLQAGADRDLMQKQEPLAAALLRTADGAALRSACIAAPVRKFDYHYLHVMPEDKATVLNLQFFPLHRY